MTSDVAPEYIQDLVPIRPLFKFLSLSENQNPPWQIRLHQLLEGQAYHPSPSQFNDPFDCLPFVILPNTIEEIRAKKDAFIARFKRSLGDLPPEIIETAITQALDNHDLEHLSEKISRSVEESRNEMGVFSLAENVQGVLMWSHYASNHTGIAIRFRFDKMIRCGLTPLFKVIYSQSRPCIPHLFDQLIESDSQILLDAMRTKAKFWEYEREWRSIQPAMARRFVAFESELIDGIVLGANCTKQSEREIRQIVRDRPIEFVRAYPDKGSFELRFEPDVFR